MPWRKRWRILSPASRNQGSSRPNFPELHIHDSTKLQTDEQIVAVALSGRTRGVC